jgi:hypothetical protein
MKSCLGLLLAAVLIVVGFTARGPSRSYTPGPLSRTVQETFAPLGVTPEGFQSMMARSALNLLALGGGALVLLLVSAGESKKSRRHIRKYRGTGWDSLARGNLTMNIASLLFGGGLLLLILILLMGC